MKHYETTGEVLHKETYTALRQALANEALDRMADNARELGLDYEPVWSGGPTNKDYEDAMRAKGLLKLTASLEQPAQQEPVAYIHRQGNHWEVSERFLSDDEKSRGWTEEPLYTHPQARESEQPAMKPCAGRNCGSTNPNLHSAECFEDYEKSTGMAQQEPVANIRTWHKDGELHAELWNWDRGIESLPDGEHDLYIRPQAREPLLREIAALSANALDDYKLIQKLMAERQPLTDEQIESLWDHGMYVHCSGITALRAITRAIEAKLKEKNA